MSRVLCDLGRVEILLIAQQDHGARHGRQPRDQVSQAPFEQRIVARSASGSSATYPGAGQHGRAPPEPIDRPMADGPPQPEEQMGRGSDPAEVAVSRNEDVLSELLGVLGHFEHPQRERVDDVLVARINSRNAASSPLLRTGQRALERSRRRSLPGAAGAEGSGIFRAAAAGSWDRLPYISYTSGGCSRVQPGRPSPLRRACAARRARSGW